MKRRQYLTGLVGLGGGVGVVRMMQSDANASCTRDDSAWTARVKNFTPETQTQTIQVNGLSNISIQWGKSDSFYYGVLSGDEDQCTQTTLEVEIPRPNEIDRQAIILEVETSDNRVTFAHFVETEAGWQPILLSDEE